MTRGIDIHRLIDEAEGAHKALLAAEVAVKTGRQHGPIDGNCEVCGTDAESFVLQDWKKWHCQPCAMLVSEHAAGFHHSDVVMDCPVCVAEWKELVA